MKNLLFEAFQRKFKDVELCHPEGEVVLCPVVHGDSEWTRQSLYIISFHFDGNFYEMGFASAHPRKFKLLFVKENGWHQGPTWPFRCFSLGHTILPEKERFSEEIELDWRYHSYERENTISEAPPIYTAIRKAFDGVDYR